MNKKKILPRVIVLPLVPNVTRKHKKFFDSSSFFVPMSYLAKIDPLAAYAVSISHTPGLFIKAQGCGTELVDRFSGPTALGTFNMPFTSSALDTHVCAPNSTNMRRSSFPWLFLTNNVPSLQTQPVSFFSCRPLSLKEIKLFKSGRGGSSPLPKLYEVKLFFLNLDLPSLNNLSSDGEGPVPALFDFVENEFYSFSTMLTAKYPEVEFPLVTSTRLKKDPLARASVDELNPATSFKWWRLAFRNQTDLIQLLLMFKSKLIHNSHLMESSEPVAVKIAKKWI